LNETSACGYYTDIANDLLPLQTNMKDLSPRAGTQINGRPVAHGK